MLLMILMNVSYFIYIYIFIIFHIFLVVFDKFTYVIERNHMIHNVIVLLLKKRDQLLGLLLFGA